MRTEFQHAACAVALFLLTAACAAAQPSALPLEADLEFAGARLSSAQDQAASVKLRFTLANRGERPLQVLTWGTPLEGALFGDYLDVRCGGRKVAYSGIVVKREVPEPHDYIALAPGSSQVRTVDLAGSYDLPAGTDCEVRWEGGVMDAVVADAPPQKGSVDELRPAKVGAARVAFSIGGPEAIAAAAVGVGFNDCDSQQQATLNTALDDGQDLARQSQSYLEDLPGPQRPSDVRYRTWFGVFEASRYDRVTGRYGSIVTAAGGSLTLDCSGSGSCGGPTFNCANSTFAFTCSGGVGQTIWLCPAFWRAPANGRDSKAGTVVHELSHWFGTRDHRYGCSNCESLAASNPVQAVENADNTEYFAENACP